MPLPDSAYGCRFWSTDREAPPVPPFATPLSAYVKEERQRVRTNSQDGCNSRGGEFINVCLSWCYNELILLHLKIF